jgi:hypothetical protein
MRAHPTVTASTMIAHFNLERKVRCHTGAVETILERARSLLPEDLAEGDAVYPARAALEGFYLGILFCPAWLVLWAFGLPERVRVSQDRYLSG